MQVRRWQRILILSMLSVSVLLPIFLVPNRLKDLSLIGGRDDFNEDLSTIKYRPDALKLRAVEQEAGEGLKGPKLNVYRGGNFDSVVTYSSDENHESEELDNAGEGETMNSFIGVAGTDIKGEESMQIQPKIVASTIETKDQSNHTAVQHDQKAKSQSRKVTDEKVKVMKDQLIRAKAYLTFVPPSSNSHFVKELKQHIKEVERAVGEADKDSDLAQSALHKMKSMEVYLSKASRVFPDCSAMVKKLRAMAYNTEEQVRMQRNQEKYLVKISSRTTTKGLHCLSMRLTTEYFSLLPEERQPSNQQNFNDPNYYHFAVFSDNVLACDVVVSSTVSSATEPEKIVFHVLTDSLNLPAISMWFILNPPGNATIQIQSVENFKILFTKYNSILKMQNPGDARYSSALNHLRFYLPYVFPKLDKILLFDHDVVIQRDLTGLWSVNMKGKVNGAVETCQKNEASFRQMDTFLNFSDPLVEERFDVNACTWAFGMNLFDLREWRRRNLTAVYQKYLQLGSKRPLFVYGSLPLGWITFYNQTVGLDNRWHILGLGYESGVEQHTIEQAAVIHYNGVMKPWLDMGIEGYKGYWSKHVKYDHPYLQQCNIQE